MGKPHKASLLHSVTTVAASPRCVPTGPTGLTHSTRSNAAHQLGENAMVGAAPILGGVEEVWREVGVGDGDVGEADMRPLLAYLHHSVLFRSIPFYSV